MMRPQERRSWSFLWHRLTPPAQDIIVFRRTCTTRWDRHCLDQHGRRRRISSDAYSSGPLHDAYHAMVASSHTSVDAIQLQALQSLERLRRDLVTIPPDAVASHVSSPFAASSSMASWGGWFRHDATPHTQSVPTPPLIRGVYLHGGVGCGKTFLMNSILYESLDDTPWAEQRQKTHFHSFLVRVHQAMHAARHRTVTNRDDSSHPHSVVPSVPGMAVPASPAGDTILPAVMDRIASAGRFICLDEFQVTDVADALILQRLFTGLWQRGCVVVATSNRPPDDLYWNGLQRDRFLPFIDELKIQCEPVSMWASQTDYRLVLKQRDAAPLTHDSSSSTTDTDTPAPSGLPLHRHVYFVGQRAWKDFDALFFELAGASAVVATTLNTSSSDSGRTLTIPRASLSQNLCRFTFEELCQKALGAGDYLLIGQRYSTVFVEAIPLLRLEHLNWVRRFILFIDAMYECHCKVILHALDATDPSRLFQPGDDTTSHDEVFAFARTVSRLTEMSSRTYLQHLRPSEV